MLALVLALSAPASASAKVKPIPKTWIGVMADGPLATDGIRRDGEWDRMKAAHVGFVRTTFYWAALQPTPDTLDLTATDGMVLAAARRGMVTLPVVTGAPAWAAANPGTISSPPRDPAAYAAVLAQLVARYGPKGTLWAQNPAVPKRPVRTWQVWNEPNITAYWSQQPFARAYVALVKAARTALKAAPAGQGPARRAAEPVVAGAAASTRRAARARSTPSPCTPTPAG